MSQLNAMIEQWDEEDKQRRIGSRPRPVSEYFAVERPLLQPLPDEPYETGRLFSLRVDRFSQISVRTNRYSVPVRLIGRTLRAMLHASERWSTTASRRSPATNG
ncbi:Mu transposase domain-containing protein [Streptomyces massasporeus]|uniref:Mu transposase domain-containing protein n=1 Tax=Streptomyces massasporeus TaxID=67324 RepID=UPI00382B5CBD